MPTVVEHHNDNGSGMAFLMGAIILVVLAILAYRYGLPAVRQDSGTQIIPDQIDVNVKQEGGTEY